MITLPIQIISLYFYSYLVGAVPTAFLLGKLAKGIDLRHHGSCNLGGANLAHHAGRKWLLPLGIIDVLIKGSSPVLLGHYWMGLETGSILLLGASLLALVGHNWSPFMGFQGGRGIAVVSGILLALSPVLIAGFLAIFTAGWLVTRSAGVWVLLALTTLPLWVILLGLPHTLIWSCTAMLCLVLVKRLLANGNPMPQDLSRRKVLFNRAFRDRDIDSRSEWVNRVAVVDRVAG